MNANDISNLLTEGTLLEGPHWTEPVRVLTAKARGNRVEVRAVGLNTKRLWNKLLTADEFDSVIKITLAGELAALDGNPTHFRLAAEAHRIRLRTNTIRTSPSRCRRSIPCRTKWTPFTAIFSRSPASGF